VRTKFKVYYEAEINGEKIKGIEEPCSWFLLTQTGEIMEYGPTSPPSRPNKGYTKLIPLFFTGLLDRKGKEIYEGDIVKMHGYYGWKNKEIKWNEKYCCYQMGEKHAHGMGDGGGEPRLLTGQIEVIGNIYENPDLLEK